MITLAPEKEGSFDFIQKAVPSRVVIAIGQTEASEEVLEAAFAPDQPANLAVFRLKEGLIVEKGFLFGKKSLGNHPFDEKAGPLLALLCSSP